MALSDFILGFWSPQELSEWANTDDNMTKMHKWHAAVRDSYDNLTADYKELDGKKFEQQCDLRVGQGRTGHRDELAGECDELSIECDELIAAYDRKQIEL